MPYRFNPFTCNLDFYKSGTGGVTRSGPTSNKAIPRWVGINQDVIDGSQASIQDSGAVNAQGFITNRQVNGIVVVSATETWIAPSLEVLPGSIIQLGAGGQLIIV